MSDDDGDADATANVDADAGTAAADAVLHSGLGLGALYLPCGALHPRGKLTFLSYHHLMFKN